jgi:CHAT domain-containing protein
MADGSAPTKRESRSAGGGAPAAPSPVEREPFAAKVIINHGRERRLELTLAQGDITQIDASCYVVGLFKAVEPGGAAAALNRAMNGRISDLIARRMFGAEVGEISVLPNGRRAMRAPNVAFAGLGSFDSFTPAALKLVCDNLVRTFVAAGLDNFAMVPFGWGSASDEDQRTMVRAMLEGFVRAIEDSDTDRRFRELTICELSPERFALINDEIHDLGQRASFGDLELTIRVVKLPELAREAPAGPAATPRIYLMAREIPQQGGERPGPAPLSLSVLTTGDKAAIQTDEQPASPKVLGALLEKLEGYSSSSDSEAEEFGDELAKALLTDGVATALKKHSDSHLVVVHDAAASRIPWETLRVGGDFPALTGGLSHRYEASDLSVAKWLQCRQQSDTLSVLLVANPTGDLPGAKAEGQRISEYLKTFGKQVALEELWEEKATKDALAKAFASGRFDMVHYAGHAFFDPQQRGRSGVFCAGHEVLSGEDLATIDNLPTLMFFNACEAARVRGADEVAPAETGVQNVRGGIGFAEGLLRGGIANFIGTYWPIGDNSASAFAGGCYPALLDGATLNEALLKGRCAVRKEAPDRPQDWANYVFYGDPDFRLKMVGDGAVRSGGANGQ